LVRSDLRKSAWLAYLLVGGALALLYYLTDLNIFVFLAVPVSAVTLLWVHSFRIERGLPWKLVAAGLTSYLIAEILWVVYSLSGGEVPFPSLADIFYLAPYPLVGAGLLVFIRDRSPGRDRAALIDAAVITVVSSLLAWVLIIEKCARMPSLNFVERIISVAYPLGDLILLALLARLLVGGGMRSVALGFLGAGVVAALVGDVLFLKLQAMGYETALIDLGWICNYTFWGVAVLHPSARTISAKPRGADTGLTRRRLMLLAGVSVAAPVVLAVEWACGATTHVPEVVAATVAVFTLVLLRMGNMNREIKDQVHLLQRQKVELRRRGDELRVTLEERNTFAEKLRYQASHDSLTGLANRATFMERVQGVLESSSADGSDVAVLFLDVDDFKVVNDRLGHVAGDELLVAVASRLRGALRSGDLAARLGGDEFGVLVVGAGDEDEMRGVAGRILQAMRGVFEVSGTTVEVHSSIGIAFGPSTDRSADQLVRDADTAMYLAKRRGKDRYEVFDFSKQAALLDEISLKAELPAALGADQFELHYQPIVELETGVVVGAEALVRWNHPHRGLIHPRQFISLAEESDVILSLGEWVLSEACARAVEWVERLGPESRFTVSVNVSNRQLVTPAFVDHVGRVLEASALKPDRLVLEFTESTLLTHEDGVAEMLEELQKLGIRLAIDDFGTGYASLAYLRHLPADILKIDKSFVAGVSLGAEDRAIAHAILRLGTTLNKQVVAEGIESEAQRARLLELGCRLGQGYLFSPPLVADRFSALVAPGRRLETIASEAVA
jgi:diguanylate cyclase (GGDEF)-like protein